MRTGSRLTFTAEGLVLLALAVLGAIPAGAPAQSAVHRLSLETPRDFGYVIGDRIEHRVSLELRAPYELDRDSLPERGRLTRWLILDQVGLDREAGSDATRYRIRLVYQVVNAPRNVLGIGTPPQRFRIVGPDGDFPAVLPAWPVTIGPIVAFTERVAGAPLELRPIEPPPPIPTAARWARVAVLGATAGALLVLVGYPLVGRLLGRRGGGHFARAYRRIAKRARAGAPGAYAAALADLHEAFNATAGRAVFEHGLDRFFAEHPHFEALREPIQALFVESRRVFYAEVGGPEPGPVELGPLRALCRACRDVERGS